MPVRVGFWFRLLAFLLDIVLFFPAMIILDVSIGTTSGALHDYLIVGAWLIYSFCEILFAGTPGKLILGLRINRADGVPADFWRKFLRWSTKQSPIICQLLFMLTDFVALYFLSGLLNFLLCVGFLYASTEDKQAWHDQWSGTAIYRRRTVMAPPLPLPPAPLP